MLVVQGDLDFRIPTAQGLSTFTALQRKGIESELLVFPDENHWVLKPANSLLWHHTVIELAGSPSAAGRIEPPGSEVTFLPQARRAEADVGRLLGRAGWGTGQPVGDVRPGQQQAGQRGQHQQRAAQALAASRTWLRI